MSNSEIIKVKPMDNKDVKGINEILLEKTEELAQTLDKVIQRLDQEDELPEIKIKYHNPDMTKVEYNPNGNFYDLRAAKEYNIKQGEFTLIDLGISIKLPDGFWGQVVPRSSLFKNHGLIQTNSFGVIDTSYCGEEDHWKLPVYATRVTTIEFNERICQFRIVKDNNFYINEVDHMDNKSRGGFGSTGKL